MIIYKAFQFAHCLEKQHPLKPNTSFCLSSSFILFEKQKGKRKLNILKCLKVFI